MTNFIQAALQDSASTLEKFMSNPHHIESIQKAIDLFTHAFKNGGHAFSCGNGGSLCDSMHFAEELTGRYRKNRRALPAVSIADPSHMSCVGNDFGYDQIFAKFLEGWGHAGDVLVAISTSGNSANVIEAVKMAHSKQMKVIGLLGKTGGALKDMVDLPIVVEAELTDRIQEIHIKIIHILIEGIERELFPENYR